MPHFDLKKTCPRCGKPGLKDWKELDDEERMAAVRMPASAEFTADERRMHRFCTRCWFEEFARPDPA